MARKFLKNLGIGGRSKGPPPPKVDYSAQKSSSVQELLPKSPPSERSRVSSSVTTSGINEFDNTVTGSPGHRIDKGHGGARPKELQGGGISPKQSSTSDRHSIISLGDEGSMAGPAASDGTPQAAVRTKSKIKKCQIQIVSLRPQAPVAAVTWPWPFSLL